MEIDYFQVVRRDGPAAIPMLSAIADINLRNADGENLLHTAIAYGNHAAAIALIQRGIDVNAQDRRGQTPLHYAAALGDAEVARAILENAGDLAIVDSHANSAMWTATFCAKGTYTLVELLVQFGGGRAAALKNRHGRSAIDFARQIGDEKLLKLLDGSQ
jgi:ankyrin repeat protein